VERQIWCPKRAALSEGGGQGVLTFHHRRQSSNRTHGEERGAALLAWGTEELETTLKLDYVHDEKAN